jgi:predicted flap endonuclease-1-like 5' DNA nuclease
VRGVGERRLQQLQAAGLSTLAQLAAVSESDVPIVTQQSEIPAPTLRKCIAEARRMLAERS